jgi:hypothetical protein
MTVSKKLRIVLLAGIVGFPGLQAAERIPALSSYSFVSTAEARVGRPLTPVSVAGVARRPGRRCAVGVYYC